MAEFAQLGKPSAEGRTSCRETKQEAAASLFQMICWNGADPGLVSDAKKDYIHERHTLSPIQLADNTRREFETSRPVVAA